MTRADAVEILATEMHGACCGDSRWGVYSGGLAILRGLALDWEVDETFYAEVTERENALWEAAHPDG